MAENASLEGLHIQAVARDPEFKLQTEKLRKGVLQNYGSRAKIRFQMIREDRHGEVREASVFFMEIDGRTVRVQDKDLISQISSVIEEFSIGIQSLLSVVNLEKLRPPKTPANSPLKVTFGNDGLILELNRFTRQKDLMRAWGQHKQLYKYYYGTSKPSKLKPPENYRLVYAIFRQRKKGKSFKRIFQLLESGQLPLYDKKSRQFGSEDSLARYYRKYAPDT